MGDPMEGSLRPQHNFDCMFFYFSECIGGYVIETNNTCTTTAAPTTSLAPTSTSGVSSRLKCSFLIMVAVTYNVFIQRQLIVTVNIRLVYVYI